MLKKLERANIESTKTLSVAINRAGSSYCSHPEPQGHHVWGLPEYWMLSGYKAAALKTASVAEKCYM